MAGISVKLPLTLDENDGMKLNKTMEETIQQNLKTLILTAPGERCMDLNFGVGLRRYFFENMDGITFSKIESSIREQSAKYMPFIEIQEIDFSHADMPEMEMLDRNILSIKIFYKILPLDVESILEVSERIQ